MGFPLLIFTDLDGTLLDHQTYSFNGAAATLERLRQLSIPLILTSSKTRAEMRKLQEQLGLNEAFISENGGGIFLPPGHALQDAGIFEQLDGDRGKLFGRSYAYIRSIFATVRDAYNIKGFGDMSVEEIMQLTGLAGEDALLAAKREFTEPFVFLSGPRQEKLQEAVSGSGLTITRGGRFYHLMGAGQDKGRAVVETTRLFRVGSRNNILTVGLGDAQNDSAMLRVVDIPVLIPRPDGSYADVEAPGLRRAPFPGSRGWGIIVADILGELAGQKAKPY
ncbi:MAG: HAD-IIB family hydrolase [Desulfobulbaceae bacterium]|nr:HAD-IIB family hydrolase [Desulfobulbaceae bacterium]